MSDNTPQNQVETTSVFRADLLKEMENGTKGTDTSAVGTENLEDGQALLVVKRGSNAGARFLLDQDTTTAGRHPEADIFLDDVTVSRRHAEFRRNESGYEVVDVGSLNGTYVNRTLVDGTAALRDGDEVQIGKFRMIFHTGGHGRL